MDFDWQWLLLAFPATFLLGWLASRMDLKQVKRENNASPQAYFKGLNLLLNEQQDKAIDAFIEAVQHDPDTSDLHFALGNLFRRRGEYERAIRVHQHLLSRGDLKNDDRDRAMHALAQDFLKAGLMDRAEEALKALQGSAFSTDARLALLSLYERSRDWHAAIDTAQQLEKAGTGSFASRIAHYWCEIAHEADSKGRDEEARQALHRGREASPQAARPVVMEGQRLLRVAQPLQAMQAWEPLMVASPQFFALIAKDYAQAAQQAHQQKIALDRLQALYTQFKSVEVLAAIQQLQSEPHIRRQGWTEHLEQQPSLTAAKGLLTESLHSGQALSDQELSSLQTVVTTASRALQRYRCAACGFEGQHYFWQCPGCQSWDSYPPRRMEEL